MIKIAPLIPVLGAAGLGGIVADNIPEALASSGILGLSFWAYRVVQKHARVEVDAYRNVNATLRQENQRLVEENQRLRGKE